MVHILVEMGAGSRPTKYFPAGLGAVQGRGRLGPVNPALPRPDFGTNTKICGIKIQKDTLISSMEGAILTYIMQLTLIHECDSDVDRENKADFTSSTTTTITDVVADEELEYGSTYAMG